MRSQEKLTAQSYLSVLAFLRDTTHFYLKLIYIRYLLQDNTSIFTRYIVSIDYIQMFFILNLFHIEEITCCDKAKFSMYRLRELPFFSSLTVCTKQAKGLKFCHFQNIYVYLTPYSNACKEKLWYDSKPHLYHETNILPTVVYFDSKTKLFSEKYEKFSNVFW